MSIDEKIAAFAPGAELMPGVVIVHEIVDFGVLYMSSKGLDQLGIGLDQLVAMGSRYHEKFFNNEDMEDFMERLKKLLQKKDPSETFTFFQQVRILGRTDLVWHVGSIRIFHQDEDGNPTHTIATVFPIDQMKHIPNKAQRLMEENTFFRNNRKKFERLGKREKEVLKLVAFGKTSAEIAEELCISVETVNTHRKNIKRRLEINTTYEFTAYAHAYDLI